jgi:hypothetical protein
MSPSLLRPSSPSAAIQGLRGTGAPGQVRTVELPVTAGSGHRELSNKQPSLAARRSDEGAVQLPHMRIVTEYGVLRKIRY